MTAFTKTLSLTRDEATGMLKFLGDTSVSFSILYTSGRYILNYGDSSEEAVNIAYRKSRFGPEQAETDKSLDRVLPTVPESVSDALFEIAQAIKGAGVAFKGLEDIAAQMGNLSDSFDSLAKAVAPKPPKKGFRRTESGWRKDRK
jgi:hypothetical protein